MIRTLLACALLVGTTARVASADDPTAPTPPPADPVPEQPTEPPAEQTPTLKLEHTVITSAPVGVAREITASVPADANVTVTLFYRRSGDEKFASVPMVKRNDELFAMIPATAMTGGSVQYYIEVRDPENKLVTRNGKSTSPNLIVTEGPTQPSGGQQLVDTRPPFERAKWIASGSAVAMFTVSLTTYLLAKKQHDILVDDSRSCGAPPCRPFDEEVDQKVESRGQRLDATYKVTLGLGVGAAAVAGYFWYRALTAKSHDQQVMITPVLDKGVAGASAEVRF